LGVRTILTLTGIAREEELAALPVQRRPDWVVKDLREL